MSSAQALLLRQFRDLTDPKKGIPSFHIELEDDNIFIWNVGLMVLNKDSVYYGGYFRAQMKFPQDYPFSPPSFRFQPSIYHPNIYKDGRLCISILHQGGDPTSDEPDAETWSPVQSVESVLISIVSLFEDPNPNSPANVDAAVEFRDKFDEYKKKVQLEVERSKQDLPKDFVIPTDDNSAYVSRSGAQQEDDVIDDNFWYESEEDDEEEEDESFDDDSIMDGVDVDEDEEVEDEDEIASDDEK